ncbi:MAG TPA: hydroxysqualene dehydroxylase HpnE [Candidatus Heimdallarchaeota archaeon]|nr:hydroxysqualene dehydroxylase HpnE [Candidatus Heimdallarchaeota archaeon]
MKKAIVIGGGAAGIAAACRLAECGIRVLLLERSPRMGGRAASFNHHRMGEEIDYGQHILMRCCTDTIELLDDLGVLEHVFFQPRLRVPIVCGTKRAMLASTPLPGPLHLVPSLLGYRLVNLSERLGLARAGLAFLAQDPPENLAFSEWLQDNGQGPRAIRRLWNPICVATLNDHAETVSASAAAMVIKEGFLRPCGAAIGLFTAPLSRIFSAAMPFIQARGGTVRLKAPVEKILIEHGRACGVQLTSGDQIPAEGMVVAVPPPNLLPLLPQESAEEPYFAAMTQLHWSPIVNLHLWYDRPVMDESFLIAVESPVQAIFDVSRIRGSAGPTHIVLSQSAAQQWINLSNDEIRDQLLSALEKLLPAIRTARLLDALVIKHPRATFLPAPRSESLRPKTQAPIDHLFLAGDFTATGWPSTLEGAVRSGRIAAERLIQSFSPEQL